MSNLAAFGYIMGFSLMLGAIVTCVYAGLGIVELPKNPKEFLLSLIEYWLYQ